MTYKITHKLCPNAHPREVLTTVLFLIPKQTTIVLLWLYKVYKAAGMQSIASIHSPALAGSSPELAKQ